MVWLKDLSTEWSDWNMFKLNGLIEEPFRWIFQLNGLIERTFSWVIWFKNPSYILLFASSSLPILCIFVSPVFISSYLLYIHLFISSSFVASSLCIFCIFVSLFLRLFIPSFLRLFVSSSLPIFCIFVSSSLRFFVSLSLRVLSLRIFRIFLSSSLHLFVTIVMSSSYLRLFVSSFYIRSVYTSLHIFSPDRTAICSFSPSFMHASIVMMWLQNWLFYLDVISAWLLSTSVLAHPSLHQQPPPPHPFSLSHPTPSVSHTPLPALIWLSCFRRSWRSLGSSLTHENNHYAINFIIMNNRFERRSNSKPPSAVKAWKNACEVVKMTTCVYTISLYV